MFEYDDVSYQGLIENDVGGEYPQAGGPDAQPEVQHAVRRFQHLPEDLRQNHILLYWLLGSGTPPYKASKPDVDYTDFSSVLGQECSNCVFAYQRVVTGQFICSKMRGTIQPSGWCNRWES